jgi:hypothetical protein
MARIGENIQAGLGRVDYSPLAQGIIAGGQARAQGIASLGQAASTAITAYFKRKEEDQRISSEIQSLKSISQRPGGKAILEPLNIFKDDGSFDDATATALIRERGLNGVVTLGSALKDLERQAKAEVTNKRAIEYSSILEMGGGKLPSPYSNEFIKKGFTPEERMLGKDLYTRRAAAEADLGKTIAETARLGMPEKVTADQRTYNAAVELFRSQYGRPPTQQDLPVVENIYRTFVNMEPGTTFGLGAPAPISSAQAAVGSVAAPAGSTTGTLSTGLSVIPLPGSKAAAELEKANRERLKEEEAAKSKERFAEQSRIELDRAIEKLQEAKALVSSGAGGPIEARLPGMLTPRTEFLQTKYDEIRALTALDKLFKIKEQGGNILGPMTDKDLEVVASSTGALRTTLRDSDQIAQIENALQRLIRMRGSDVIDKKANASIPPEDQAAIERFNRWRKR